MRLVRLLFCLLALTAVAVPAALADRGDRDRRGTVVYELQPAAANPEGVAFDRRTGFFYVSSVGSGTIYRGRLDDPLRTATVFLPAGSDGRTSATGMKIDDDGRLYVAGALTSAIFVYDTRTAALLGRFDTPPGGFINDLALTRNGDVYATDSLRPVLWRIPEAVIEDAPGSPQPIPVEPEIQYVAGFNLNGIDTAENGRSLYTVQSNTGRVYRVTPSLDGLSRTIDEVPITGGPLQNGDGLIVDGNGLIVVQNQQELVTEVKLSRAGTSGAVVGSTTDPTFHTPTTAAFARDRLLVVNSQFSEPVGPPFTVSSIRRPSERDDD